MRIWTKSGDLAFKTFTFPDGQPHFKLETYDRDFDVVTVEARIANPSDLFMVLMAVSVLRNHGYATINLDIPYLMGARMDRAIDWAQPFTLALVAKWINSLGLTRIRILDVHSEVAIRLIRNSENVLPVEAFAQAASACKTHVLAIPDKGATERVRFLANKHGGYFSTVQCLKTREMATGKLLNFSVLDPSLVKDQDILIVDDICDGGGTFTGLAKVLREAGAKRIYLYVTHGIFSKTLPLEGIDTIYTTDSYRSDTYGFEKIVCIPISMKDL